MVIPILSYGSLSTLPISSASSGTTAYNLARKALLQRNLNSLDSAVAKGDLASSKNALKTLVANNPQYHSTGPVGDLESPINSGFRDLAKALDDNKISDAQAAWKKLTTEFEKQGLAIKSGNETATMARAELASYTSQSLLSTWQTYNGKGVLSGFFAGGDYSAGSFLSANA